MSKKETKKVTETKNTKQIIILIALIIAIIFCIVFCVKVVKRYNDRRNKTPEIETDVENASVLKDATVGNLKITDVDISINEGITNYKAIVSNESASTNHINTLNIIFTIDGTEEVIPALMDVTFKANEKQIIDLILDTDISKVTKIDYRVE